MRLIIQVPDGAEFSTPHVEGAEIEIVRGNLPALLASGQLFHGDVIVALLHCSRLNNEDLLSLIQPVRLGEAHLVLGHSSDPSRLHRWAAHLAGTPCAPGPVALSREALLGLRLTGDADAHTEILFRAREGRLPIQSVQLKNTRQLENASSWVTLGREAIARYSLLLVLLSALPPVLSLVFVRPLPLVGTWVLGSSALAIGTGVALTQFWLNWRLQDTPPHHVSAEEPT